MLRIAYCTLLLLLVPGFANADAPLATVDDLDLERYLGRWYQIALLPNRFQKKCARDTMAEYSRKADGSIRVLNTCRTKSGQLITANGEARRNPAFDSPARLEVRFAPRWLAWLGLVWGDYWVMALDDDYEAVLVGAPNRKYLWILARSPTMSAATYAAFVSLAEAAGFPTTKLAREPGTSLDDARDEP